MPCQPGMSGAAANDLVGEERIKIMHRVDLGGGGVRPGEAECRQAALHVAEHVAGFLAHGIEGRLAAADDAFAVARPSSCLRAPGNDEARRFLRGRHGEGEGINVGSVGG